MQCLDDGSMKFLVGRQKNVREVLALCVSRNKKVIAVCEKGRSLDDDPGNAQVRSVVGLDFRSGASLGNSRMNEEMIFFFFRL